MSLSPEQSREISNLQDKRAGDELERLGKARTRLYISALGTIAVFATNAIPTKIEPLGIDFSKVDAARILPIMSLVASYFSAMFLVRWLQFAGENELAKILHKQAAKAAGSVVHDEWRKANKSRGDWIFAAHKGANAVSIVLQIGVPMVCGLVAALIGFFPSWFGWLKFELLGAPA